MTMGTSPVDVTVPFTRPYAWPWNGELLPDSLALVVVQAPQVPPAGPWRAALSRLSLSVQAAGGLVVEVMASAPATARRGAHDAAAPEPTSLLAAPADHHLRSAGWSGFFGSPLDQLLRKQRINQLLLTGYWFEVGVHSTMRSANDRGYECLLVEDAVASSDADLTTSAVSSILMSGGIFGAVGRSADVTAALARANHPAR